MSCSWCLVMTYFLKGIFSLGPHIVRGMYEQPQTSFKGTIPICEGFILLI